MIDIWKVKRTEPRISLHLPVIIEGDDTDSNHFSEATFTENVSKSGACIIVTRQLKLGSTVKVSGCQGKFEAQATVRGIWIDDHDRKTKIGVQFNGPTTNWVVS